MQSLIKKKKGAPMPKIFVVFLLVALFAAAGMGQQRPFVLVADRLVPSDGVVTVYVQRVNPDPSYDNVLVPNAPATALSLDYVVNFAGSDGWKQVASGHQDLSVRYRTILFRQDLSVSAQKWPGGVYAVTVTDATSGQVMETAVLSVLGTSFPTVSVGPEGPSGSNTPTVGLPHVSLANNRVGRDGIVRFMAHGLTAQWAVVFQHTFEGKVASEVVSVTNGNGANSMRLSNIFRPNAPVFVHVQGESGTQVFTLWDPSQPDTDVSGGFDLR